MITSPLLSLLLVTLIPLLLQAEAIPNDDPNLVNCTLCADGSAPKDMTAIGNFGDVTLTCGDVYNNGTLHLPPANCTFLQGIGDFLCSCNTDLPTVNDCTLCEDGSNIPEGLLESFPGKTCAAMQVDARRDEEEHCSHYQAVLGHYCGCSNPVAIDDSCRICGYDLPNPQLVTNGGLSCIEVEFEANMDGTCSAATSSFSEVCCPTNAPAAASPPGGDDSSSSRLSSGIWEKLVILVVAIVATGF